MQSRAVWFKALNLHHQRLPKVEAFHSKRTPFTIRNSGKRCRQGILLGIKFLVVQSNWISGVSGLVGVFDYDL